MKNDKNKSLRDPKQVKNFKSSWKKNKYWCEFHLAFSLLLVPNINKETKRYIKIKSKIK